MNDTNTRGAHTPGPWTISSGKEYKIQGKGEQVVFLIGDDRRLIPNLDDARLIAAAPELLAALEWFADELPSIIQQSCPQWVPMDVVRAHEVAKSAIAKARGAV